MNSGELQDSIRGVVSNIERVIIGKNDVVEFLVLGFLTGGHVLIEDVPGVGKTMLARSLAKSVSGIYKRIQFTPDLLPSDVTGATIFNMGTREFEFREGPVFANILLADEINRATPRTQSSLLECMEEGRVTADGVAYALPRPFFVVATQNPIEHYGTFPLPDAQLDRFSMRLRLGYPSTEEENRIVEARLASEPVEVLEPVMDLAEVTALRSALRGIFVDSAIRDYAIRVCRATRHHSEARLGASPRASILLVRISQGIAALHGRDFVIPQDVKDAAVPVLSHRIMVHPYAGSEEASDQAIVRDVLDDTPVPAVSLGTRAESFRP